MRQHVVKRNARFATWTAAVVALSVCFMIGCLGPVGSDHSESDLLPASDDAGPLDEPATNADGDAILPGQPADDATPGQEPSNTPPIETPAPSESTNSNSTESKPAEDESAENNPADEKPVDEKPVDEKPAEDKPADSKPAPPAEPPAVSPESGKGSEPADAPPLIPEPAERPLFEGWPQPQMVFMLTGRQLGYVEPCGCTGLENQKGGLARRHVFLQSLLKRNWKVAPLDVGSQVKRYGAQAELKFQMSTEALNKMGYRGVAFGAEDLLLSVDALISASVDDSPFMSANASVLDLSATHRVFEMGGRKIGVTAVLGKSGQRRIHSDEVEITSVDEGLAPALAKIGEAGCDYVVVLAHATHDESRALAGKYPNIDLIVTSGGAEEPAYVPEQIANSKTRLVQVGAKGMYAGVLGLFDDAESPIRFQRVPMDARFSDSPDMLRLMKTYQAKLKTLGLSQLGVRPLPHPSGRKFVGSEACADCHSTAYEIWEKTPHAKATESIKFPRQRSEIARHHDPECLSCHVTGWNAAKYTPYVSGYLDFSKSAALHGNGCENCHGPGSSHVAAELGDEDVDEEERLRRQSGMRLTKADAEKKCLECHDLDNSPDFHVPGAFAKYWKGVEHKGKD